MGSLKRGAIQGQRWKSREKEAFNARTVALLSVIYGVL